jgi:arylamine N-acetyltransferase
MDPVSADEAFDIDAYCARIGYAGPRTRTYDVLAALVEHHSLTLPFENIDVLLGRAIRLDAASLQAKLVRGGRGGYCFEHNELLAGVLRQIGFEVTTHMGRGRWRVPPGVTLPRTHMVLTVAIAGERFLVPFREAADRDLTGRPARASAARGRVARPLHVHRRARASDRFRGRQLVHVGASGFTVPAESHRMLRDAGGPLHPFQP